MTTEHDTGTRRLSLMMGPYDHAVPLRCGDVRIPGFELHYQAIQQPTEIFGPVLAGTPYDVAEMALTHSFALMESSRPFRVLPVFPSRMFRHSFIFVGTRSGIGTPKQLEGRRIGIQGYQMTAALWIRGMLRDEYGVDLSTVQWVEGGVNEQVVAGSGQTILRPTRKVDIARAEPGRTLNDMLVAGELDAIISATIPAALHDPAGAVKRLFPNFREVEAAYFKSTGIFPIMHAIVVNNRLYDEDPGIAAQLATAFESSKRMAMRQARFTGSLQLMVPWLYDELATRDALLGPDPWAYGVEPNLRALQVFARYVHEEGFTTRPLDPAEVFVPLPEARR